MTEIDRLVPPLSSFGDQSRLSDVTDTVGHSGLRRVRRAWYLASADAGWTRPRDWWAPEVDGLLGTLAEAVIGVASREVLAAVRALSVVRADAGVGLAETLDDLGALYALLPGEGVPASVVRAASVAWAESALPPLAAMTCEDPLTGLASAAYLRTRLAEIYREAERCGTPVTRAHAFVVVLATPADDGRWRRVVHRLELGECLRAAFSGEESWVGLAEVVSIGLVRRSPELTPRLVGLRTKLTELTNIEGRASMWLESLPGTLPLAYELLKDLSEM